MEKYILYPFLFALLSSPLTSGFCQENDQQQSPVQKIEQYQKKILILKGDIALQQGLEKEESRKADQLLSELERLDAALLQHQNRLKKLLADSARQKENIKQQERELKDLKERRNQVSAHLQKRSAALYTMGKIGLINATFSSKTLPDLLTLKNAFDTLLRYDKKVLSSYENTLELRRRGQRALKLHNTILTQLIEQRKEEEKQIVHAKEEKIARLAEIRSQKKLRQQAIKELHNASKKLTASIAKIKDNVVEQQKKFHISKGRLPIPVKGGTIVTRFQQMTSNAFGEQSLCNGIEIQSPEDAEVIAISDGKVSFAGYLQGYGNTLIINHGMHYYSVLSRLEAILVKQGAKVQQGEKIALSGESATLFTKGIYFEIRKQQQQLNPLEWIAPEQQNIRP